MWKKETKTKTVKKLIVVLAVLAVLFILGLSFAGVFRVRQVTVTGNAYYTKEEVVDLLLDEGSLQNTLLVYLRYKYQEHPEIPFIDDFEVTMDSWQSLKIRVYEKNMVGYVRYLGQDVYFDKDGIVVESSTQELEGIPQISGVTFDSLAIHQPLSVEDPTIFDTILSITKLLTKYDLDPDEIRFGAGGELFLQLGDVKVALGTGENLDEKISRLKQLEGDLKDKSGTLHMENYTDSNRTEGRCSFWHDPFSAVIQMGHQAKACGHGKSCFFVYFLNNALTVKFRLRTSSILPGI